MAGVEFKDSVSGNRKAELRQDMMQMVEDRGGMACVCVRARASMCANRRRYITGRLFSSGWKVVAEQ